MRHAASATAAAGLLVFVCCLAAYVATLNPGLCFPVTDSHELTLNTIRLGVPHPAGYPLYVWVGFVLVHLLPFGDAAYRLNLMSALCGATAAAMVVPIGVRLGIDRTVAAFAGLLLGASTTLWSQAVMTEVYAPDLAALTVVLWLLLTWGNRVRAGRDARRWFVGFALALGLSAGTHISNLGFAPAFTLFVLTTDPTVLRRPREIAIAFAAFALGAAQYLWLPLRGGLYDQYPNLPPTNLAGIWLYTLGAFSNLRFAFPLGILPFRFGFYVALVQKNFGLAGLVLGTLGTWSALRRHPRAFWLLLAMYVTNVFVFVQFAVPDPDVFFIAGYLPWVLFIAFGVQGVVDVARAARARLLPARPAADRLLQAAAAVALVVWLAGVALPSFAENDRSRDTQVADFERNLFAMLPPDSFLVGLRGAFGADLLYWQIAHHLRPDVTIRGQWGAPKRPPGAPFFTIVRVADGAPTSTGRLGQFEQDLPRDAWYVPVLFGNAYALRLTRIQETPPALLATDAPPAPLERRLGPLTLVGATAALAPDAPSPRLHVDAWWRVPQAARFVVSTSVDDLVLESHDVGLENLLRVAAQTPIADGAVVREAFDVVLPSTLPHGPHAIRLGATRFTDTGFSTDWTEVARVDLR